MFIFEKIIELYRNDLVSMIQINLLTVLFSILFYQYWKGRNNPLSRQVLDRMKKSKRKKITFDFSSLIELMRSRLVNVEKKAAIRLARANLDFTPGEYVTFFIFGVIGGAAFGFLIFPFANLFKIMLFFLEDNYIKTGIARLISGGTFALIGTLTPYLWTKYLIKKRKKAFNEQLLEFLMSLADGVKSSPTVQEAISVVSKELPDPLSSELKKAVQELQYAKPFDEVLSSLAERIGINEYTLVINAMQIQDKTGGELEKLLRNMAKVFQERQELIAEVNKMVRGPKSTSYVLLVAPFVLTLVFSTITEDFFSSLFASTIGWICVAAAVVCYVVAFFLVIKINEYIDKVV